MKRFIYIFLASAVLIPGLWGCQASKEKEPVDAVELRYRADSNYELSATGAKAITILVASTKPWTITNEHPEWCIISDEDGAACPPEAVHAGKAEATTITINYYDNTLLDDRIDHITIQSDGWVGKTITVRQKGGAYLTIPKTEREFELLKAGEDVTIHISSNQDWSAKITRQTHVEKEGEEWLTLNEGATGFGDGVVTLTAVKNPKEMRYATVEVYDRYNELMYSIPFTQDGVLLDPDAFEIRASFDQESGSLGLVSNREWTVEKVGTEDWFEITTTSGTKDGTIKISLQKNDTGGLRRAEILLKNKQADAEDYVAEKTIVVKQAYEISPVKVMMDQGIVDSWTCDWENLPVYNKNQGLFFKAQSRLHKTMPFGAYTFHWSSLTLDPNAADGLRVRHWFCFDEGAEIKMDIRPVDKKVSFDFNAANDGNKPSIDGYTDVDFTQPVEVGIKFDPSGAKHCKVTLYVNGKEAGSFESSDKLMRTVTWGAKISDLYFGVDKSGSAICEWYEYTEPIDWGD